MRGLILVIFLSGCAQQQVSYQTSCPSPKPGNSVVMAMGEPTTPDVDAQMKTLYAELVTRCN